MILTHTHTHTHRERERERPVKLIIKYYVQNEKLAILDCLLSKNRTAMMLINEQIASIR